MNQPKVIVFDVDGTMANCEHRRHFVAVKPKNWPAFNRAMKHDTPHDDIIYLFKLLQDAGNIMIIATGRSEEDRVVTETWLAERGVRADAVYMRKDKDYRSDDIVKEEILEMITAVHGRPDMVFDDRQQVVDMWRRNGIRCLQVAPGDF